jgi:hypothetical protein
MSRGEVNARRSTVTLHMVSSLDSIIAKKDNSVSWLNSSGDVHENGVPDDSAEEVVNAIDCCTRCLHVRACAPTGLAIWRHSDRRDHKQRAAVHEKER